MNIYIKSVSTFRTYNRDKLKTNIFVAISIYYENIEF